MPSSRPDSDPPPDRPEPQDPRAAQTEVPPPPRGRGRVLAQLLTSLVSFAMPVGALFWLLTAPATPLVPEWNPTEPLDLAHPITPLTGFKLRRAAADPGSCLAALATGAAFRELPDLRDGDRCAIAPRVELRGVSGVRLPPVETTCGTALRLALWEAAVLPGAALHLGSPVVGLSHQGSYNCRAIRGGTRMSSHATAAAIDVDGVVLADGRRLPLRDNWEGDGPEARFWRAMRDGACDWFGTVLGPEFDANHANHLHLQSGGWGTCR